MARKVKCKACKTEGINDSMFKVATNIEQTRFAYYCNEEEYILVQEELENKKKLKEAKRLEKQLLEEQKKKDSEEYKDLMKYVVEDLMGYEKGMVFPVVLVKKMRELRNFYPYYLIKQAFYEKSDAIKWAVSTKKDMNEFQLSSYIMTIAKSEINDLYIKHEKKKKFEALLAEKTSQSIDVTHMVDVEDTPTYNKSVDKGISKFLEEDDLF